MHLKGTLKTLPEMFQEFGHTQNPLTGKIQFELREGDKGVLVELSGDIYECAGKEVSIKKASEWHKKLFKSFEVVNKTEEKKIYEVKMKPLDTILMAFDYKFNDKEMIVILPDAEYSFPFEFVQNFGNKIKVRKNEKDELVCTLSGVTIPVYLLEHVISSTHDPVLGLVERLLNSL